MKKKPKKIANPCTSTASAGALRCVLELEHAGVHSSSIAGRRASQYATWSVGKDGRLRVITYSHGKTMGEWFETAPPAAKDEKLAEVGYCGARFESFATVDVCTLVAGHIGPHVNTSTGVIETDVDPTPLPSDWPEEDGDDDPTADEVRSDEERELARKMREDREAHAAQLENETKQPSLVDACPKCGREFGEHDGKKCPKPETAKTKAKPEPELGTVGRERLEHVYALIVAAPGKDTIALGRVHRRALKELAEADRIEWRDGGWFPTTDDKPEAATSLRVHPAADVLPLIEGPEFEALVEDIRVNGLRHKLVTDHSGEWLVDGRNRKRACERCGIAPEYEALPEGTNIAAFVISTNLKRRHLSESQRAAIASEIANLSQGRQKQTRPGAGLENKVTQAEAAAGAGVGERTVQRANAVHDNAVPELWTAVKQGKVDLKGAEQVAKLPAKKQREIVKERIDPSKTPVRGGKLASIARQEEKRAVVRAINEQRVEPMPLGSFGVIYGDYPWLYENSDQHEGSRGHMGYPPMTMDQIVAHAREAATRAAKDCVIALWVTNLYVTQVGRVIEAFGADHRTMMTWPKPRAGIGTWPRGQTEHLVIASIGAPVHTLNEVTTLLQSFEPEHPDEHSSKPAEVAELLRKHCCGPFLELFGRSPRDGWAVWGAEATKFATEAA